ncbi:hypothetical protein SUGI_0253360 [Cryptomeria japonica]|nr:hypothetical protein SUGI_0253360 [Cryptomeria japonica]
MAMKTGAKSSTERALSSLEKRSSIVKEMRSLEADKAVVPHYQWPTANSSNRAREKFKPFTQSPPPHFTKCRRSLLGDVGRKSSLLGSRTSEKSSVQINGLKPSKSFQKTALKIDALKLSRAHGMEPPSVKQFLASRRESESNFAIQFNIPRDVHSPIDKSSLESSISSKFDEGEDVHTIAGGAIETNGDDFEEQHLEYENTTNEITRMSNECDDDTIDHELSNEMRDYCDISMKSLIGSVPEYESHKSGLKGYKILLEENKNKLYCLKFRQGRVYPNSEAEKVDLRYEMTEERRAPHEGMVDYAITKIVKNPYALTNMVKNSLLFKDRETKNEDYIETVVL